ncbi:hypothetical protein TNCV_5140681 [Trichonephila clavipes]|nr:hypothetical protein TNCV_5140681 [Trichonephila clavipes]
MIAKSPKMIANPPKWLPTEKIWSSKYDVTLAALPIFRQVWMKPQYTVRGIFDVKDAPHTDKPVVKNVNKITETMEVDRLVSNRSIAQGL